MYNKKKSHINSTYLTDRYIMKIKIMSSKNSLFAQISKYQIFQKIHLIRHRPSFWLRFHGVLIHFHR